MDKSELTCPYCEAKQQTHEDDVIATLECLLAVDAAPVVRGRWEMVANRVPEHGEIEIIGTAEQCTNVESTDFCSYGKVRTE